MPPSTGLTAFDHEWRRFRADHPGTPLGKGTPSGSTLRLDGESHRQAWMRLLRADPCAYCGRLPAGTIDHVVPKASGRAGVHDWLNLTAACQDCNGNKNARSLLGYLAIRAWSRPAPKLRSSDPTEELAA